MRRKVDGTMKVMGAPDFQKLRANSCEKSSA
jgi:hypothetical protein